MKALVLKELKEPLTVQERETPEPRAGQVLIELRAAALNRRDYWITQGMYPGIKTPVILGSDGAGVVTAGDQHLVGKEVIVNPGWDWGNAPAAQGADFRILGMPDDGTFASHLLAPAQYVHEKPDHLSWAEAAALPLAGVTAFRAAFTQGRLQSGETVLVSGVGGGVSTFVLQYALAAGARVFVTSSSRKKIDTAVQLGAVAGFQYTRDDWHKKLKNQYGEMDLIVDGAGGEGYTRLIDLAAPGGRIVNYGATAGPPTLDLFKLFWKQLHLIGSTMGSVEDFQSMLDFVARHQLKPAVDSVHPLAEGNEAFLLMKETQQFGKIVLDTSEV